jgi:hypothetical protein
MTLYTVHTAARMADTLICDYVAESGWSFREYTVEPDCTYSHLYFVLPVAKRYETPNALRRLIRETLYQAKNGASHLDCNRIRHCTNDAEYLEQLYQPAPSEKDSSLMALYATKADYDRETSDEKGKRTIGKPAKMLRKMFPWLSETACTYFAEQWKECFAPVSLTIKTGTERAHFAHAYTHETTPCKNPSYIKREGVAVKSLSGSCMRHTFGKVHPSEVYASGDFESIWAEDEKGRIAARCVVNIRQGKVAVYNPAPIYANCDTSAVFLLNHLKASGYEDGQDKGWQDAKLLAITHNGDSYVMPYIDTDQTLRYDGGDYFVIDDNGDTKANETRGYVYAVEYVAHCEHCGEGINEEDCWHHEDSTGESYCEGCTDNLFTMCQATSEYVRNDDAVLVYSLGRGWNGTVYRNQSYYSLDYAQEYCVCLESSGEWFETDDVTYSEHLEEYVPNDEIGDTCEYVQTESDLFLRSECVKLPCGTWAHIETELDKDTWEYDTDTGTLTLKAHLELDADGNVVNNQLTLDIAA